MFAYESRLSTVRINADQNTTISIDAVRAVLDRLEHTT